MKCKKCGADIKAGAKNCPACDAPVKQKEKGKKMKTWVLALIITGVVLGLLVGAIGIWWVCADVESFGEGWQMLLNIFDPPENNVYYKDSYTVSDKKAAKWNDKVIAQVGTQELTNGELQVYYWMNVYDFLNNYGYYAVYAGLDYSKPLDVQKCPDVGVEGATWQHFFLDDALMVWHKYQAMSLLAQNEKIQITEDMQADLDNLRAVLAEKALQGGFSSIDAMLQKDMGSGVTYEDYYSYMKTYYEGYAYFENKYDTAEKAIDQDALEKYFTENQEELAEQGITKTSGKVYDVRHILIAPKGGTKDDAGKTVYSDEEWEACRAEAQKLLDEWLEGDATEETFATLASKHSVDTGSNANGGLYTKLDKNTDFVQEFKDWYLEDSRKAGDYGLVKSEYGYHIMFFSKSEQAWEAAAREDLLKDAANDIASVAMSYYKLNVRYKDVVLGYVDLAANQNSQ